MRYSSASSTSDLVGEMPLAFSSFFIFILILSARRLYHRLAGNNLSMQSGLCGTPRAFKVKYISLY